MSIDFFRLVKASENRKVYDKFLTIADEQRKKPAILLFLRQIFFLCEKPLLSPEF
jgi:hypothetical protein